MMTNVITTDEKIRVNQERLTQRLIIIKFTCELQQNRATIAIVTGSLSELIANEMMRIATHLQTDPIEKMMVRITLIREGDD